jgi:hypothetical protein
MWFADEKRREIERLSFQGRKQAFASRDFSSQVDRKQIRGHAIAVRNELQTPPALPGYSLNWSNTAGSMSLETI